MFLRKGVITSFLGEESHSLERGWATSLRIRLLSGAFNLNCYNFSNERLRLNHLKTNRRLIKYNHVPP